MEEHEWAGGDSFWATALITVHTTSHQEDAEVAQHLQETTLETLKMMAREIRAPELLVVLRVHCGEQKRFSVSWRSRNEDCQYQKAALPVWRAQLLFVHFGY